MSPETIDAEIPYLRSELRSVRVEFRVTRASVPAPVRRR